MPLVCCAGGRPRVSLDFGGRPGPGGGGGSREKNAVMAPWPVTKGGGVGCPFGIVRWREGGHARARGRHKD